MLHCFEGQTADEAWCQGARTVLFGADAVQQDSQHGTTQEVLHAVFHIKNPRNRWVLSRQPGINPAFAIAETFWILAGRDDARFINYWNKRYPEYAGSGNHYHGAYGWRLRHHFGYDQLVGAYLALSARSDTRQVVLSIWDANSDFPASDGSPVARDIPCNICSLLKVRNGRLEWTQVMRSNDLFLGTPYNFVQFTTIQEVMAGWLGLEVGSYSHFSDSLHAYELYDGVSGKFSIRERAEGIENSDSIALPKAAFDATLAKITEILDTFIEISLPRKSFFGLLDTDMPEGYRNLMLIVAADAARRRHWESEMRGALEQCTNLVLTSAWRNWRTQYSFLT